jgi:short-subunit dehydrogenase
MPSLLVVGATSDIAKATARVFAANGWDIVVAGRNPEGVRGVAADLKARSGKEVPCHHFDAEDPASREGLWASLGSEPDAVLLAVGLLGDQGKARHDHALAERIATVNYTGLLPILSQAAAAFERRGSGTIIGIGSVAGDRGRASNYSYGAAKAALASHLSGLRNRLAPKGVRVLTVKPGFVRTAMTDGMDLPPLLTASPQELGKAIHKAVAAKKDVIYVKWMWRWVMLAIRALPEFLFKRTKL